MTKKHIRKNRILKIFSITLMILLALLLSGCRSRLTNRVDASDTVPDEEGIMQESYESRRFDLGLYEAKESVFSGLSYSPDDEEEYDEEFNQMMEDYDGSEEEEVDDSDTQSESTSQNGGGGSGEREISGRIGSGSHSGRSSNHTSDDKEETDPQTEESDNKKPDSKDQENEEPSPVDPGTDDPDNPEAPDVPGPDEPEPAAVKVSFDPDGGELEDPSLVIEMKAGDTFGSLPVPSRNDATFLGWFTQDGQQVSEGDSFDGDADMTLVAHWKTHYETWSEDFASASANVSADKMTTFYTEDGDKAKDLISECKGKSVNQEDGPAVIVKLGDLDKADETAAALHEEYPDAAIVIIPESAVKTDDDKEKLMYRILIFNALYPGAYSKDDLSHAAADLGSDAKIYILD